MADQSFIKTADQDSKKIDPKIKCDVCDKVLVKGSLKRHKETQHKVIDSMKKKEATIRKPEATEKKKSESDNKTKVTQKEKEDSDKPSEITMEDVAWSKVWSFKDNVAPTLSTRDMDQHFKDTAVPLPTFSTGELDDFLVEQNDSILGQVIDLEKDLEIRDEWFDGTTQNIFGSEFGQELGRLSLQPVKPCNECKEAKSGMTKLRKQHDNLLIKTEKLLKSVEGQKIFLRKQLKLAENEIEENREKWSNDVDNLSEEIATLKADGEDKRSKSGLKRELEEYKTLLAERVKETLELKSKIETTKSIEELNKKNTNEINEENNVNHTNEKKRGNNLPKENNDHIEITIKCKQCRFVAKTMSELRGHAKFVHLTCQFCNKYCSSPEEMDKHLVSTHPREYRPVCEPCRMIFPNRKTLDLHLKKKHSKKYVCQVCKETFEHKADMMKHMKDKHTEKKTEEEKFKCVICDYMEDSEDDLEKHITSVHNKEGSNENIEIINCPLCDYSGDTDEQVIKHLEEVHELYDDPKPRKINKPCRYFRQNRCSKGLECKFTHQENPGNKTKLTENSDKSNMCKNGLKCTYLKQNRCDFYHEIAAQPRQQIIHHRSYNEVSDPRTHSANAHKPNGPKTQVKMCRDGHNCDRARSCSFRHYTPAHYDVNFIQRSSKKTQ